MTYTDIYEYGWDGGVPLTALYVQVFGLIADFYGNPLQGTQFRLSQNMILNLNNEDVQIISFA